MKLQLTIEVEPLDDGEGDGDAERVADCLFYQLVESRPFKAGTGDPHTAYHATSFTFEGVAD